MSLTFCRRQQTLDLLDEVLDGQRGPLQLLLVRVQRIPEVGAVLEAVGELQGQQTHHGGITTQVKDSRAGHTRTAPPRLTD